MDMQEIRNEITRLEKLETTYENCTKLAVLYSVADHAKTEQRETYSDPIYERSEFLIAVSKAPINKVLEVLDEHMGAVQILYPKEFYAVLNKIKSLS